MAQVLLAIFGISFLMIVHEAGHYLTARMSGMRVTAFSLGFGPALVRYQPKGSPTVFQLCLIPLLAYVKIAGVVPGEDSRPNDPALFDNKGVAARGLTLLGGPFANYLFASLVIFGAAILGWREELPTSPMVVATVESGSPAAGAGMQVGDAVLEVEGEKVRDVTRVIEIVSPRAGKPTVYLVRRGDALLPPLTIVPRDVNGRGMIGITSKFEPHVRSYPVGEALVLSVELPWKMTVGNLGGIADLVRRRSLDGMTGPVGMTKQVATQATSAFSFVTILAALSVGIGCFNLLPFPFLDGGRLLFVLYEMVAGRRPNKTVEMLVHATGMLLLLGMAVLVTWRDVLG